MAGVGTLTVIPLNGVSDTNPVLEGALHVSAYNKGPGNLIIMGCVIEPGLSFNPPQLLGMTYPAFTYDATATVAYIFIWRHTP